MNCQVILFKAAEPRNEEAQLHNALKERQLLVAAALGL